MAEIEEHIERADLKKDFHIFSGHCLSIAIALEEYFGGTVLIVSELPKEGFDHAVLEKDGRLYDGSGHVGWSETVNRFIAPEARADEPEPHYRQLQSLEDEFNSIFDEYTYKEVLDRLEDVE